MTEEQIIQNANKYANNPRSYDESVAFKCVGRAFIADAHSRDEEIKELRKHDALENKMRIDLINECEQLKQELGQLRNPWISVEDDTPKISAKKGSFSSEPVFVRIVSEDGMVYHGIGSYYVRDKSWCIEMNEIALHTGWKFLNSKAVN